MFILCSNTWMLISYRPASMEASETKINRNGLCMAKMQVSIWLGRKPSDDGFYRPFLEDVCKKTLLEHGIRVDLRLCAPGRWCRRSWPIRLFCLLFGACFVRLLGPFLGSFPQLIFRDPFSSLII